MTLRAIEFFSGIGGFACVARDLAVEVVAAFDQDEAANKVYEHNFSLKPNTKNLDAVAVQDLSPADLWWLSPPCAPYSVRGRRLDDRDPRALSLANLIRLIPECRPGLILLENVQGFVGSVMDDRLRTRLRSDGYFISEIQLCPTVFGVPVRRPRYFMAASRHHGRINLRQPERAVMIPLRSYLSTPVDPSLNLSEDFLRRYERGLNIVNPDDENAMLICFTSNYWKCTKASGSLVRTVSGARRVAPEEMLVLFGFPSWFVFPEDVNLRTRWRLLGNSLDVSCVTYLLRAVIGVTS